MSLCRLDITWKSQGTHIPKKRRRGGAEGERDTREEGEDEERRKKGIVCVCVCPAAWHLSRCATCALAEYR